MLLIAWLIACDHRLRVVDPSDAEVAYVGDSLLAWNERHGWSIPAAIADVDGRPYASFAVNGAEVLRGDDAIPTQAAPGVTPRVVISGGANDLNRACACGPCESTLDALAGPDGGAMGALVDAWRDAGAEVLLLGYYPVPDSARYGFDRCFETISALDARHAAMAAERGDVRFLDLGDLVQPERMRDYAVDDTHPSPHGARRLGAAIAERWTTPP